MNLFALLDFFDSTKQTDSYKQRNEKKFQIEYVQDSKIVKFMAYREKNMLNSPSFGGKDNYF